MLLDIGHANVFADLERTTLEALIEPVLDVVALFHVHDNLGARRRDGGGFAFDPLRLDLHLAPGVGTLAWEPIARSLADHAAPLLMEIHPSHRSPADALREALRAVVLGEPVRDVSALESLPNFLG